MQTIVIMKTSEMNIIMAFKKKNAINTIDSSRDELILNNKSKTFFYIKKKKLYLNQGTKL